MYCSNCGKEVDENTKFCSYCGKPVSQNAAIKNTNSIEGSVTKAKNHKKWIIPISVVAIISLFIVIIANLISGSGYKNAIDNCMAVYFEGDFSKVDKLAPEEFWDYAQNESDVDLDELIDGWYNFESMQEAYEQKYGANFKATYSIKEKEKLSSDALDEFKEILNEEYGISKTTIKSGYMLLINFTYQGNSDKETNQEEVYALEIDGDWYLCNDDGEFKLMYYGFSAAGYYDMWE